MALGSKLPPHTLPAGLPQPRGSLMTGLGKSALLTAVSFLLGATQKVSSVGEDGDKEQCSCLRHSVVRQMLGKGKGREEEWGEGGERRGAEWAKQGWNPWLENT